MIVIEAGERKGRYVRASREVGMTLIEWIFQQCDKALPSTEDERTRPH